VREIKGGDFAHGKEQEGKRLQKGTPSAHVTVGEKGEWRNDSIFDALVKKL